MPHPATSRRFLLMGLGLACAPALWARRRDDGDLQIVQALYGTQDRHADVTDRLRELARQDYRFRLSNEALGVDPDPGRLKTLRIYARGRDGQERVLEYREGSTLDGSLFTGWGRGNWGEGDGRGRGGWDRGDDGQYLILEARYGTADRNVDVTARLRDLAAQDYRFRMGNDSFGVDPHPGRRKTLRIYAEDRQGQQRVLEFAEGSVVDGTQFRGWNSGHWGQGGWRGGWSGDQGSMGPRRPDGRGGLQILEARYGQGRREVNITARLQSRVYGGRLDVEVNNELAGVDPARGRPKALSLRYRLGNGQVEQIEVREGERLVLP
ncbi:hypothetical protein HNQ51_003208 [Inhella inkyongensis]|uniref:Uncharacterized protein n=1 Tax=Inhella inkyongensis TaxID=392593 RepID=A0A840S3Q1_9BURK|nr:DUF3395 domain-containing protein [Inhella inkyongensis]MBB5205877.1 hypothetical protein [Inhella inkyongensis]